MSELCKIAERYGTDKVNHHTYTELYDALFCARRNTVRRVLEIGIGTAEYMVSSPDRYFTGASLLMWRDYFPEAIVYGADVSPSAMFSAERIETFLVDQGALEELKSRAKIRAGLGYDLIVDDGSHLWEHQVSSANTLLPLLSEDGLYVIEDVHVPPQRIVERLALDGFQVQVYDCPGPLVCECGCGGPEKVITIGRSGHNPRLVDR